MSLLDRLFGKKSAKDAARAADLTRRQEFASHQNLAGQGTIQTQGEQDATRGRMESQLAEQRQRREDAAKPQD